MVSRTTISINGFQYNGKKKMLFHCKLQPRPWTYENLGLTSFRICKTNKYTHKQAMQGFRIWWLIILWHVVYKYYSNSPSRTFWSCIFTSSRKLNNFPLLPQCFCQKNKHAKSWNFYIICILTPAINSVTFRHNNCNKPLADPGGSD